MVGGQVDVNRAAADRAVGAGQYGSGHDGSRSVKAQVPKSGDAKERGAQYDSRREAVTQQPAAYGNQGAQAVKACDNSRVPWRVVERFPQIGRVHSRKAKKNEAADHAEEGQDHRVSIEESWRAEEIRACIGGAMRFAEPRPHGQSDQRKHEETK